MDAALVASALMLGLAGAPHCTAMCAAPCAAVLGASRRAGAPLLAFHGARIAGYAAMGALAASGVAGLGAGASEWPLLRLLWALLHASVFALGIFMLWQGRQPAVLAQLRRAALPRAAAPGVQPIRLGFVAANGPLLMGRSPIGAGPSLRAGLAGALWFAWPCGLLQSALVVAALANGAAGGAAAMAAFAVASSAGLFFGPMLWRRLGALGDGRAERWALRATGALMASLSGWALTHGVWHRVAALCAGA